MKKQELQVPQLLKSSDSTTQLRLSIWESRNHKAKTKKHLKKTHLLSARIPMRTCRESSNRQYFIVSQAEFQIMPSASMDVILPGTKRDPTSNLSNTVGANHQKLTAIKITSLHHAKRCIAPEKSLCQAATFLAIPSVVEVAHWASTGAEFGRSIRSAATKKNRQWIGFAGKHLNRKP